MWLSASWLGLYPRTLVGPVMVGDLACGHMVIDLKSLSAVVALHLHLPEVGWNVLLWNGRTPDPVVCASRHRQLGLTEELPQPPVPSGVHALPPARERRQPAC